MEHPTPEIPKNAAAEALQVVSPDAGDAGDGEERQERPVYVAKRLADAKRLEEVFTAAGIEYDVEPDTYQGGIIFRSARVGAFFYVAPGVRERAAAVMLENGIQSGEVTT